MKPRLLATDPDPLLLGIYRTYFPHFGFDVATAGDGLHCVRLLRELAPDALILSFELLWGGGEGVLACVREENQMRPIPVVLTFDGFRPAKAAKYLVPPVVKILEKPFRLRDLRASVEIALQGNMVRQWMQSADASRMLNGDDRLVVIQAPYKSFIPAEEIADV
jgi:DNA-binding response OmpR family regulator